MWILLQGNLINASRFAYIKLGEMDISFETIDGEHDLVVIFDSSVEAQSEFQRIIAILSAK